MSEWQPIETAPMDGTEVLLWVVDGAGGWGSLDIGFYEHDEWFAPDYRPIELYAYRATHWMPLPEAPEPYPMPRTTRGND